MEDPVTQAYPALFGGESLAIATFLFLRTARKMSPVRDFLKKYTSYALHWFRLRWY